MFIFFAKNCYQFLSLKVALDMQNRRTGQSGPPSKVVPSILIGPKPNGLFHWIFIQNFWNFWPNRKPT